MPFIARSAWTSMNKRILNASFLLNTTLIRTNGQGSNRRCYLWYLSCICEESNGFKNYLQLAGTRTVTFEYPARCSTTELQGWPFFSPLILSKFVVNASKVKWTKGYFAASRDRTCSIRPYKSAKHFSGRHGWATLH